jgi:hypothetical protein
MITLGTEPFLTVNKNIGEEARFNDKIARVAWRSNRTIMSIYQATKEVEIDGTVKNYLSPSETEGLVVLNQEECDRVYSECWDVYFQENPNSLETLKQYNGFIDEDPIDGQPSPATELYRIRQTLID